EKHSFISYAALSWIAHAQSSRESLPICGNMDPCHSMLLDLRYHQAICWTEVWWYLRDWQIMHQPYPGKDIPLGEIFRVKVKATNSGNRREQQAWTRKRILPPSSGRKMSGLGEFPMRIEPQTAKVT